VWAALTLLLVSCEQPVSNPKPPEPAKAWLDAATVSGVVNYQIPQKELALSFSGQSLLMPIAEGKDLSLWITNLPAGLTVASKELVPSDSHSVTLVITGTPLEEREAPIAVTIPEGVLSDYKALPVTDNADAKFEIVLADAIVEDVTILGLLDADGVAMAVNSDLIIRFLKPDKLLAAALPAGMSVNGWITDLPAGLTATIKEAAALGANSITITVSGSPAATSAGIIRVVIPRPYLAAETETYPNENARWGIYDLGDPADPDAEVPETVPGVALLSDVTVNGARNFYVEEGAVHPDISFIWERDAPIPEKELTVTLVGNAAFNAAAPGADISGWITNLPPGLRAAVQNAVPAGAKTLTLSIAGKPTAVRNNTVELTLPASALRDGKALKAVLNAGARFAIADPSAELPRTGGNGGESAATVVGVKGGGGIVPATVVITVSGDTLAEPRPADHSDVSGWFTNLPAGLSATLTGIAEQAGRTYLTADISGAPAADGDTKSIAEIMRIELPAGLLKCGVAIKALPEASAKFFIAGEAMTPTKAREMVQLNGGTVSQTPTYVFKGGIPEFHGGPFPREPNPFYFYAGNIPVANQHWDNPGPITMPSFKIGKYEVTRELWQEVYQWGPGNGYNIGYAWNPPADNARFFPQAYISCQEAIIWCNARSEKEGKEPVYYKMVSGAVNSDTDRSSDGVNIYVDEDKIASGEAKLIKSKDGINEYANVRLRRGANGYRVPTPAQWEYAARGGVPGSAEWNYRWPGTNGNAGNMTRAQAAVAWRERAGVRYSNALMPEGGVFTPELLDYIWADSIRLYDVYENTIPVGMLKPNSAGIHDMGGNLHEWTVKIDSFDPSQTITRGGAFNRDVLRSAFDSQREERKWGSSRDLIGLRVISDVQDGGGL
jgi:formylglycine-generating enzyme required for sulfatase activity